MRIEVKGRNIPVPEDLREYVERRFRVIGKQVSELAELEVEVFDESNPSIADRHVAGAQRDGLRRQRRVAGDGVGQRRLGRDRATLEDRARADVERAGHALSARAEITSSLAG